MKSAPKPSSDKKARGNPSRRAIPTEPPSTPPETLEPPATLRPVARQVWDRMVKQLQAWNKLSAADVELLCGFCNLMGRHYECEIFIEENGVTYETNTGNLREYPQVKISKESLNGARQIGEQFGFSPQSRVRIGTVEEAESDDPFDKLRAAVQTQ